MNEQTDNRMRGRGKKKNEQTDKRQDKRARKKKNEQTNRQTIGQEGKEKKE